MTKIHDDPKPASASTRVDRSPIADHIAALATEAGAPPLAISACLMRFSEAAPLLRAALAQFADGAKADDRLAFRALYLLGGGRDQLGFPILLRLLKLPPEDVEHLLGDAVTEDLPKIVAGLYNGDETGLFAAITNRAVDDFVRDALLGAATFLTWEGRIARDSMQNFLVDFDDRRRAPRGDVIWSGWVSAIALLGFSELSARAHAALRDGRIPKGWMRPGDFDRDLAASLKSPGSRARFDDEGLGYLDDVLEALQPFDTPADENDAARDDSMPAIEPATNPWRHVGRNDPCPCGSGKKAKKCCMPA